MTHEPTNEPGRDPEADVTHALDEDSSDREAVPFQIRPPRIPEAVPESDNRLILDSEADGADMTHYYTAGGSREVRIKKIYYVGDREVAYVPQPEVEALAFDLDVARHYHHIRARFFERVERGATLAVVVSGLMAFGVVGAFSGMVPAGVLLSVAGLPAAIYLANAALKALVRPARDRRLCLRYTEVYEIADTYANEDVPEDRYEDWRSAKNCLEERASRPLQVLWIRARNVVIQSRRQYGVSVGRRSLISLSSTQHALAPVVNWRLNELPCYPRSLGNTAWHGGENEEKKG